jgi:pimeloyl-ACP methyl ester carboxylesterase
VTPAALEPLAPATEREREARARLAPLAALHPFAPRFLDHGGVLQHYVDEGPRPQLGDATRLGDAARPTLVFLHGNPTWSFAWRRAILTLRERWRCVAPDHVGMGLSDKPAGYPYRLERHVENLGRLTRALDLGPVVLVMHDWGGAIGMGWARRHAADVRALVVSNSAAFRAARMPLPLALARLPLVGTLAIQGCNAFVRGAARTAVARPLPAEVRAGYALPYDTWAHRSATRAFVDDIPMRPGHPSYEELRATEEALANFADRPLACLWGERDWCFGPAFRVEWERRFPGAFVRRFESAGHWVFEDEPAGYVAALEEFLAATLGRDRRLDR